MLLNLQKKKDYSKLLCAEVKNPIVKNSSNASLTGNCAEGVRENYIRFINELEKRDLSENERFIELISSNYTT